MALSASVLGDRRPETVVAVPQWQGSGSADARRLADGAGLLAPLVPAARRVTVDVPSFSGTPSHGVRSWDVLVGVARRTWIVPSSGLAVTVGGDCGADLAPIGAALRLWGDDLTVVWFDAHGDLNTPESSPSGAFHGMVLRTLMGDGAPGLVPPRPLSPGRTVLVGTRALDPQEEEFIARAGVVSFPPKAAVPGVVADAVATGKVYVHVDLDVLDPEAFGAVGFPVPGGLSVDRLAELIRAVVDGRELLGMGIMEFMPRSPADVNLAHILVGELFQSAR
jgi:arginase